MWEKLGNKMESNYLQRLKDTIDNTLCTNATITIIALLYNKEFR